MVLHLSETETTLTLAKSGGQPAKPAQWRLLMDRFRREPRRSLRPVELLHIADEQLTLITNAPPTRSVTPVEEVVRAELVFVRRGRSWGIKMSLGMRKTGAKLLYLHVAHLADEEEAIDLVTRLGQSLSLHFLQYHEGADGLAFELLRRRPTLYDGPFREPADRWQLLPQQSGAADYRKHSGTTANLTGLVLDTEKVLQPRASNDRMNLVLWKLPTAACFERRERVGTIMWHHAWVWRLLKSVVAFAVLAGLIGFAVGLFLVPLSGLLGQLVGGLLGVRLDGSPVGLLVSAAIGSLVGVCFAGMHWVDRGTPGSPARAVTLDFEQGQIRIRQAGEECLFSAQEVGPLRVDVDSNHSKVALMVETHCEPLCDLQRMEDHERQAIAMAHQLAEALGCAVEMLDHRL